MRRGRCAWIILSSFHHHLLQAAYTHGHHARGHPTSLPSRGWPHSASARTAHSRSESAAQDQLSASTSTGDTANHSRMDRGGHGAALDQYSDTLPLQPVGMTPPPGAVGASSSSSSSSSRNPAHGGGFRSRNSRSASHDQEHQRLLDANEGDEEHAWSIDDAHPAARRASADGAWAKGKGKGKAAAHAGTSAASSGWLCFKGRGREVKDASRTVTFADPERVRARHPANVVRNQKYNVATFIPIVLYEQFKFFFNLYFLLVALSQFVPALKIGFIATYVAPLAFVLCVTIGKEAFDDYTRFKRDVESNSAPYKLLVSASAAAATISRSGTAATRKRVYADLEQQQGRGAAVITVPSSRLKVGDLVYLEKNQRVPADMVLLRTTGGDSEAPASTGEQARPVEETIFVFDDDDDGNDLNSMRTSKERKSSFAQSQGPDEAAAAAEEEKVEQGGSGTCFVRTDQLDGETDWKLRVAVDVTQQMSEDELVRLGQRASIFAGPPIKDIHTFLGNFTLHPDLDNPSVPSTPAVGDLLGGATEFPGDRRAEQGIALSQQPHVVPLTAENVLWANTVLAAGNAIGCVVYTGKETRAVMNTSHPETKVGLLDLEINRLSKILCAVTFALSVGLVALNGFRGEWWVYIFRFLILFSSIIPISLRVNLDMGKTVYARQIMSDDEIPGTIVRTSTLPEELGRIEYLLSDKTGTLTQNEMELKKLHMGTMSYSWDSMDEVATQLAIAIAEQFGASGTRDGARSPPPLQGGQALLATAGAVIGGRGRRDMSSRVKDVVLALALCHNVTPIKNEDGSVTYQASSPDEVAIVRWTESVGLALIARDRISMSLRAKDGSVLSFDILEVFPFTSESKRMGIVIRERSTGELMFYQKGADVVMARIVAQNDWLEEECGNMAREGLRTLVVARKRLTEQSYGAFERAYKAARIQVDNRNEAMARAVSEHLEQQLELLGLTGVEDKLQEDVKTTLELLRNAGIKVWMLTGDKIETATCIAISSKLVARNQYVHQVAKLKTVEAAQDTIDFLRSKLDCCLVIDGESLQLCLDHYQTAFIELATQLSAVVACRCSPTQKADVAKLIRAYTKKRVCCIGDGGNDVSMIQAADVGIGIVGKEGKQASLAADFSINQFSFLTKLLVWHGRNSYKRSAKLAQFVIHRGLIISIIQAVFSAIFYFAPIALYQGWLMVGYATIYTMAPVFSLVLDRDVSEDLALLYPELYKELTMGRSLSAKTFTEWLMISIYQGGAIMILSLLLFENEFLNIVSISFTALVLNELIMVALEITTWHIYMFVSEIVTLFFYCISIAFLPEFFDLNFVLTTRFIWKTVVIVAVSSFPLYIIREVKARLSPPSYSKLAH